MDCGLLRSPCGPPCPRPPVSSPAPPARTAPGRRARTPRRAAGWCPGRRWPAPPAAHTACRPPPSTARRRGSRQPCLRQGRVGGQASACWGAGCKHVGCRVRWAGIPRTRWQPAARSARQNEPCSAERQPTTQCALAALTRRRAALHGGAHGVYGLQHALRPRRQLVGRGRGDEVQQRLQAGGSPTAAAAAAVAGVGFRLDVFTSYSQFIHAVFQGQLPALGLLPRRRC